MNRDNAIIVAGIVDRMTKLENTIFKLEEIRKCNSYKIVGKDSHSPMISYEVSLNENDIATVVFNQDVLQLFIDTLNLELDELIKSLEEIN